MTQHNNPSNQRRTACAPYNFIPLPDRVVAAVGEAEDLPDHGLFCTSQFGHNGYLEVTLESKTPIFVRGPLSREERRRDQEGKYAFGPEGMVPRESPEYARLAKNKPDFFYVDSVSKQPVIPGSSLRGMLRTVLEIVSFSKFSHVSDRQLIYRAVGATDSLGVSYRNRLLGPERNRNKGSKRFEYPSPLVKGGFLERTDRGWLIRPARTHYDETFVHVEQSTVSGAGIAISTNATTEVCVKPAPRRIYRHRGGSLELNYAKATGISKADTTCREGWVKGHLVRTTGLPAKHMDCVVFAPDQTAERIPIPSAMKEVYEEDCELPRGKRPTRDLRTGSTPTPLFYLLDDQGNLVYFGSTMMFRLPHRNTVNDCVPRSLQQPSVIDFSEAMFGYVREEKSGNGKQGDKAAAYASRVNITQAALIPGQSDWKYSDEPITPKILASPKPTCFQHYLVQQHPEESHNLTHYSSPEYDGHGILRGTSPLLRGTKLFWHQGNVERKDFDSRNTDPNSTQHTLCTPLKEGIKFQFRVDFSNLSNEELGALLWILQPRGPLKRGQEREYCHKIGMGKPYGLGSVKLSIDRCVLIDRKARYQSVLADSGWNLGGQECDSGELDTFKKCFENRMIRSLGLEEVEFHRVKRIAMLLAMMERPGFKPSGPTRGDGAERQDRRRNTRYMTIQLDDVRRNQQNEYKSSPVLPDPSDFFDQDTKEGIVELETEPRESGDAPNSIMESVVASSSQSAQQPQLARDTAGLQHGKGETITIRRETDKVKRGKTKEVFVSTDDEVPARFLNPNDAPAIDVGDEITAKVDRTEQSPKAYVVKPDEG